MKTAGLEKHQICGSGYNLGFLGLKLMAACSLSLELK